MWKLVGKFLGRAWDKDDLTTSPVASTSSNQQPLPTSRTDDASSSSPTLLRASGVPRQKIGLFELSKNGERKTVDVVAVHGLQGDAYLTWKHDNGSLWLRDFLPADIPFARIMTFGYDSTVAFSKSVANIEDKALELLNRLSAKRLGGIVVKKALILAHERSSDPDYKDVLDNTKAIAFLGVPHKGSDSAWWATFAANALKGASIGTSTNTALVADLKKDSTTLSNISKQFVDRARDLIIYTFYETEVLFGVVVVDERSARIGLPNEKLFPVNANHRMICKIPSFESHEHDTVCLWIAKLAKRVAEEAVPEVIAGNKMMEAPGAVEAKEKSSRQALYSDSGASNVDEQKRIVITGLGGQGKSEICLRIANITRQHFWGVFWVDVSSASIANIDFVAAANMIDSSVKTVDEAQQLLANIKESWLLILDNADNTEIDYQEYIPSGTCGTVVITSRNPDCHRYSTVGAETLAGLDIEDSVELLLKAAKIPRESWPACEKDAKENVGLLESHTLALIQAGAYIANGHCKLEEYPAEYRRQHDRLLKYGPNQARSRYGNVYATFEASACILEASTSIAASDASALLDIMSVLYFSGVPMQLFKDAWKGCRRVYEKGDEKSVKIDALSEDHVLQLPGFIAEDFEKWDSFRVMEAIRLLISLALVTAEHDTGVLSMHPLTHVWAKGRRQRSERQGRAFRATGSIVALSSYGSQNWRLYEKQLHMHTLSYLDTVTGQDGFNEAEPTTRQILFQCAFALSRMRDDLKVAELLSRLFSGLIVDPKSPSRELLAVYDLQGENLRYLGKSEEAVQLLKQVVEIRESTLAESHPNRLTSQHALAGAYRANGQVKEAVKLLEQVVKIRESTLAESHPNRLASQHALAGAYRANGQVKEAVKLLEQVVKIKESTLAESHPSRLASQHALAGTYEANGQVKEAVKLLEQVVKIEESTMAESHPSRLASQHALAGAYEANGQVKEAVKLLEQVVKIQESTLAESHPSRLASQRALAGAYGANGQVKEAVKLLEQVVKIEESTLAGSHPSRLASQHALAGAYGANGQVKEAVKLLEQVVKIQESTLAESHPNRLASQHALAGAYGANGQVMEAVKLLEQVVKIRESTLAESHPSRLASQHALAGAYRANGQVKEAVKLLEQVVKIEESTLAESHPSRLASQHALAGAYRANGQVKEAVKLLEQVVKIRESTLAESHPDRLASQHELAGAYGANGQVKEAVKLLEQVVKIKESTLAESHPDWLASQHALAGAYETNGQVKEAVKLLEQVVKIQESTLAESHPSRLASQHALAGAYRANGQVKEAVKLLEQVVNIEESTLAESHPSRLASQHSLAIVYRANGQVKEAVKLLEQVVKIEESTLAESHPSRLASQHSLAIVYRANGQVKEAVKLLEQVVKIEESTLAESHPDRLASQRALAGAYRANGQVKEAVMLLEQVVKIEESTLAESHPSRLASQHALAIAYRANGQVKEAVKLQEQVVKIRESTLAESHPSRLASQHELAVAYGANGQIKEAVKLLEQVVKIEESTVAESHPDRLASQHALGVLYQEVGRSKRS
ncbi:Tetratricopeptide-like helical domain [Lasallia pustulata]|uniref:Tetratricopeptide-like helical domain n=1 Tax=Lasallia pustulata TaxID=136370 RepID=A0A1W5D2C9_9LECA|nr:Tetratricopeptide-like helical domain [Lasallia pustulata]